MRMRKCLLFLLLVHLGATGLAQQPSNLIRIKAALPKIKDSLRYTDALNRMAMLLYEKTLTAHFIIPGRHGPLQKGIITIKVKLMH